MRRLRLSAANRLVRLERLATASCDSSRAAPRAAPPLEGMLVASTKRYPSCSIIIDTTACMTVATVARDAGGDRSRRSSRNSRTESLSGARNVSACAARTCSSPVPQYELRRSCIVHRAFEKRGQRADLRSKRSCGRGRAAQAEGKARWYQRMTVRSRHLWGKRMVQHRRQQWRQQRGEGRAGKATARGERTYGGSLGLGACVGSSLAGCEGCAPRRAEKSADAEDIPQASRDACERKHGQGARQRAFRQALRSRRASGASS